MKNSGLCQEKCFMINHKMKLEMMRVEVVRGRRLRCAPVSCCQAWGLAQNGPAGQTLGQLVRQAGRMTKSQKVLLHNTVPGETIWLGLKIGVELIYCVMTS